MDLLVLKNIGKAYDNQYVCKDINLSIREGEFFTFLGPSGCGKTTILRLISGFINPDKGTIFLGEKDITKVPAEKRNIGMVFQNYALFPYMNVYENVEYGLKIKKLQKSQREKKVRKYLKLVNLEDYEKRKVSELSGGEQQRVALARSLVMEPKVLLLDEPLSNLDARLKDKMRIELKEIQNKLGVTTILVTHDQAEALAMADRIAVFNNGSCVQTGTPNEIYFKPVNTFVATFVGETNLFEAEIIDKKAKIAEDMWLNLSQQKEGKFISIRPQDVQIKREYEEGINQFKGRIEKIKTSGVLLEYIVTVNNLIFKVVNLNTLEKSEEIMVGESVYLSIEPKKIKILQE